MVQWCMMSPKNTCMICKPGMYVYPLYHLSTDNAMKHRYEKQMNSALCILVCTRRHVKKYIRAQAILKDHCLSALEDLSRGDKSGELAKRYTMCVPEQGLLPSGAHPWCHPVVILLPICHRRLPRGMSHHSPLGGRAFSTGRRAFLLRRLKVGYPTCDAHTDYSTLHASPEAVGALDV